MKIPNIKVVEQLLSNKEELFEYLRDYDNGLRSTDIIEVLHFEYGIKLLYSHNAQSRPFKTRVYLNRMEDTDLLR